jgi:cardiolipin synthase
VLALFPFFGLVIYYLFGQQYRKTNFFNRKHVINSKVIQFAGKSIQLEEHVTRALNEKLDDKIKRVKLLKASEQSPLTILNEVKILFNEEVKFAKLIYDLK